MAACSAYGTTDGAAQHRRHRVVRPRRIGQQHLVAGVEQAGEGDSDRLPAALADDDLVGGVGQTGDAAQALDDRLAQWGDAEALRVAHPHRGGLLGGRHDVRLDREVGLADLEPDDVRIGPRHGEIDDLADSGWRHSSCPRSQLHPGASPSRRIVARLGSTAAAA